MKEFLIKNKNYILIIITCLILLLPILLVGSYDRPIADDYDYSIFTHEVILKGGNIFDLIMAAIQMDLKAFNGWTGLYSSSFIQSFQPGIFGESFYSLTCIIMLVIPFIFLYFSMRILNKHYIKKSNMFVFTSTLVILTILTLMLPSATEGLYWYNGAINYMPWAFSNFLGICILIELFYTDKKKSVIVSDTLTAEYKNRKFYLLLIFSTLLSFLTSGGNHVTGFANILFMLIATIFLVFKKNRHYSLLPLLFAIIGFIIMYTAPGTAIRQSWMAYTPSISNTFIKTFYHMNETLLSWLNYKWILTLILITPISASISKNIKDKINIITLLISIICSLIIIGAMFAIPHYAMGVFGAPRLTNVVWITFIILSWINYTLIISLIEQMNIFTFDLNNKHYKKWFFIIAIISLFLIFCLPQNDVYSNSYTCLQELNTGTAENFAIEMDDRINLIKSSNQDEIKVKPISPDSVLYFSDIGNNASKWPNTSFEIYYNKTSIYIDDLFHIGNYSFKIPEGYKEGNRDNLNIVNLTNGNHCVFITVYENSNNMDDYVNKDIEYITNANKTPVVTNFTHGDIPVTKLTVDNGYSIFYWFEINGDIIHVYTWDGNDEIESILFNFIESIDS